jgi:hypothetical protein
LWRLWQSKKLTEVIAREDNLINAKLATGEIEIVAKQIEILNTSKPVPFQIDALDTSEEVRLKYRFLDLALIKLSSLAITSPLIFNTNSLRTVSAKAKSWLSGLMTTCTMPRLSRTSKKITPPWK